MIPAFNPRSGFNWEKVRFDWKPLPRCSYCETALKQDEPMKLWAHDSQVAQFCPECALRWFDYERPNQEQSG